jgi:protein-L-isoaspartate(D-aspartate) O-methyltransferase
MTADVDVTANARHRLVETLIDKGALSTSEWFAAFRTVPRHAFVSRFSLLGRDGSNEHYDLDDPDRRDASMAAVYADQTLITRWDEGGAPISSSSTPSLMATMLEALDVHPGHRVLEIGTGTGYNAALLAHRLGNSAVTTIDLDPELVDQADAALRRCGYRPTVVCGDGAAGYRDNAPYDRIIATCGVSRIPTAWLEQTLTGGTLLANLSIGLARLVALSDGSVRGRFLSESSAFMPIRATADSCTRTGRQIIDATSGVGTSRTDRIPDGLRSQSFTFLFSFAMPDVELVTIHTGTVATHCLFDPITESWARAETDATDQAKVTYRGPRDLWNELQSLTETWHRTGQPDQQRYGLDVTATGRHLLWLDDPSMRCGQTDIATQRHATDPCDGSDRRSVA